MLHQPPAPPRRFPDLPRLTPDQEQDLAARRIAGDHSARELLILSNLPLALSLAKTFRGGRYSDHIEDLRSAAIKGLIDAVDRYQPGKLFDGSPVKFVSFAADWIYAALNVAEYEEIPMIRVPKDTFYLMGYRGTSEKSLATQVMRKECIEAARRALRVKPYGIDDRAERDFLSTIPSVERDVSASGGSVPARPMHASSPDLDRALARLAREYPVQHEVVRLLYPMDGGDGLTLRMVGKRLGTSFQYVEKLMRKAAENLRGYIEDHDGRFEMGRAG